MSLCPVVACSRLSKDKVVWPEYLAIWAAPDTVYGAWLQVDKNSPGDVLASAGLVVVHVDPLKLQVRVAMVGARGVDAMLVRDDLPELQKDESVIVGVPSTVSIIW